MGFIKAFTGALGGAFADEWKDFYVPMPGLPATAALSRAVPNGANSDRSSNNSGSQNIITNGSKIVVPEGMALVTMQDGGITGVITEPGGFIFSSDDPNSRTMFAGDGIFASTLGTSLQRFQFGGVPSTEQLAFYVNLKEIPGNRFGTDEVVNWNDSFLETKAGGMARGTYSLKIVDPILFIKSFVPVKYLEANAPVLDFNDIDSEVVNQLFEELKTCLKGSITELSIKAKEEGSDTMDYISTHQVECAQALATEINNNYKWEENRGLKIVSVSLTIAYDEKTQALLDEIRADDAEIRKAKRMGEVYQNNMPGMMAAASAEAMKNASSNESGAMMGFMGLNMAQNTGANMLGAVNQMNQPNPDANQATGVSQNPTDKLLEMKKLLDAGAITQEDYDKVKNQILGL